MSQLDLEPEKQCKLYLQRRKKKLQFFRLSVAEIVYLPLLFLPQVLLNFIKNIYFQNYNRYFSCKVFQLKNES